MSTAFGDRLITKQQGHYEHRYRVVVKDGNIFRSKAQAMVRDAPIDIHYGKDGPDTTAGRVLSESDFRDISNAH